ncbi:MAG: hypothetical protein EBS30_15090, partial [Planctomycetes bacterium]|nr:hypothetical protein [Planctomycetota bacterium]
MNRIFGLLPVASLLIALAAMAQPPASMSDALLRFDLDLVDRLREARDFDLAISLLKRLEKRAPDRLVQLRFASAQVRVEQSASEPDMTQREKQRRLARADL